MMDDDYIYKSGAQDRNRELCRKYPFLHPYDEYSGEQMIPPDYDYEWTPLDEMPIGWNAAFGEKLCAELAEELDAHNKLEDYRIVEIKEKFGELRWYDNGNTHHGYEIIDKYRKLSRYTCVLCGKPATRVSTAYIMPFCDEHIGEVESCDIHLFYGDGR